MQLLTTKKNVKLEYSRAQFYQKYILSIRIRQRENSFTSKVEWKLFTLFRITDKKIRKSFLFFVEILGIEEHRYFVVTWMKTEKNTTKCYKVGFRLTCNVCACEKLARFADDFFTNFCLFSCKLVIVIALAKTISCKPLRNFQRKKTEKYRAVIGKFFKVNVKNCHHCEKTPIWFNFHSVFWTQMVTEFAECARKHVNFHVMHLQRSWCVHPFLKSQKYHEVKKNVLRSCHINQTMTNQIQTFRIFVADVKSCDLSNFLCFFSLFRYTDCMQVETCCWSCACEISSINNNSAFSWPHMVFVVWCSLHWKFSHRFR